MSNHRIEKLFNVFKVQLIAVPEFDGMFRYISTHSKDAVSVFSRYERLLAFASQLNANQKTEAATIRQAVNSSGTEFSASRQRLWDLIEVLGEDYTRIVGFLAAASLAVDQSATKRGLTRLVSKLERGHNLKTQKHAVRDGDSESDAAIWGHTYISGDVALLHFILIHYFERCISEQLVDMDIELGKAKDYFVNAVVDCLLLDGRQQFADLYDIVGLSRDDGAQGVGWRLEELQAIYDAQKTA